MEQWVQLCELIELTMSNKVLTVPTMCSVAQMNKPDKADNWGQRISDPIGSPIGVADEIVVVAVMP